MLLESAAPAITDGKPRRTWRHALMLGLFAFFAVWCVLAFRRDIAQIDLTPLGRGWSAVALAAGLSLLNYALRIARWRLYLRQLGHRLPLKFVSLTFMAGFAFTLSPGKLGEMVRARYYQPKGIAVSDVTAAFFVERLLDLLAMMLLTAAVLAELQRYRPFLWVALALVGGLLGMLAVVPWAVVQRRLDASAPHRLLGATKSVVGMLSCARQFLTPRMLAVGLALGLLAWALEAIGLKVVGQVISTAPLSIPSAMGIYALAIIVGALSFLPGGLGSTEAVMVGLLFAHGYTMPEAMLLTLVCRLLTLWLAVLIGWVCVWLLRRQS